METSAVLRPNSHRGVGFIAVRTSSNPLGQQLLWFNVIMSYETHGSESRLTKENFLFTLIDKLAQVTNPQIENFLAKKVVEKEKDSFKSQPYEVQAFQIVFDGLSEEDRNFLLDTVNDPSNTERIYPGLHDLGQNILWFYRFTGT